VCYLDPHSRKGGAAGVGGRGWRPGASIPCPVSRTRRSTTTATTITAVTLLATHWHCLLDVCKRTLPTIRPSTRAHRLAHSLALPCGRPRSRADIIFNNGGCYLCDMTDRGPYSGPASWGLKARPGVTSWVMYNDFDIILGPYQLARYRPARAVLCGLLRDHGHRILIAAIRCCVRIGDFDIILGHFTRPSAASHT